MKNAKLIRFYDPTTLQSLEILANEGGYTTLMAFVNDFFVNLIDQKPMQVLNTHFSQEKRVGLSLDIRPIKSPRTALKSGKERRL